MVKCRIDHYQTPGEVHVSVYAKKADKEKSSIAFETNQASVDLRRGLAGMELDPYCARQVHLNLLLPGPKHFVRTLNLYGSINPEASSFTFFGTKVCSDLLPDYLDSLSFTTKPSHVWYILCLRRWICCWPRAIHAAGTCSRSQQMIPSCRKDSVLPLVLEEGQALSGARRSSWTRATSQPMRPQPRLDLVSCIMSLRSPTWWRTLT